VPQTTKQPDSKFNLRLPGDLAERVRERAAQEERSANNLIKRALKQYVAQPTGTPVEPDDDAGSRDWIGQ